MLSHSISPFSKDEKHWGICEKDLENRQGLSNPSSPTDWHDSTTADIALMVRQRRLRKQSSLTMMQ